MQGETTLDNATSEIRRGDTGIRILLTLLFAVVAHVVETVIAVMVVFGLVYALATRQPPSRRVRRFANQVVAYYYRIARYLTYNEATVPFPFSPFPEEVEPVGSPHEEGDGDLLDLLQGEPEDDDDPDALR